MFQKILEQFKGLLKNKKDDISGNDDKKAKEKQILQSESFLQAVSESESKIINNPVIPKVLIESDPALRKSWMLDLAKNQIRQYKSLLSADTARSLVQGNIYVSANRVVLNSILDYALHLKIKKEKITLISAKIDNAYSINLWDAPADIVAHRLQELFLSDKKLSVEEYRNESIIIENFVDLAALAVPLNGGIPTLSDFLKLFDDHRYLKHSIELVKKDYENHQSYEEMDQYSHLLFGKKSNLDHSSFSNRTNISSRMSQLISWFDMLLESWNSQPNNQMYTSLVRQVIKTGNDIHKTLADEEVKRLLLGPNPVSLKELINPKSDAGIVLILIPKEKRQVGRVIIDSLFSDSFSYYTVDTLGKNNNVVDSKQIEPKLPLINICLDNWNECASNAQLFWINQLTGKRLTLLASASHELTISKYSIVTRELCYIKRLGLNGQFKIIGYPDTRK